MVKSRIETLPFDRIKTLEDLINGTESSTQRDRDAPIWVPACEVLSEGWMDFSWILADVHKVGLLPCIIQHHGSLFFPLHPHTPIPGPVTNWKHRSYTPSITPPSSYATYVLTPKAKIPGTLQVHPWILPRPEVYMSLKLFGKSQVS
jgi:hypothetical protein